MVKKRNPHHKMPSHNHASAKKPTHAHSSSKTSSSKSNDTVSIPMPKNMWMVATVILAIILLYMVFNPVGAGMDKSGDMITSEQAGEIVLEFAQGQGLQATLQNVEEESGLFKVNVEVQGQVVPVYVTSDGVNLVPSLLPIDSLTGNNQGNNNPGTPPTNTVDIDMETLVDDDAIKGDVNAPVTIVEFSDYECPFCARFYRDTLGQLDEQYIKTGKVRLVYRDFPLSNHPNAQKAGEAAECAGEQGQYYEMHDLLFENGASGGVDSYKQYASDLGLDQAAFDECLDSGAQAEEVRKDFTDGQAAGVSGTPAFIINGQLVSGAQPFSTFQQIIEAELAA